MDVFNKDVKKVFEEMKRIRREEIEIATAAKAEILKVARSKRKTAKGTEKERGNTAKIKI